MGTATNAARHLASALRVYTTAGGGERKDAARMSKQPYTLIIRLVDEAVLPGMGVAHLTVQCPGAVASPAVHHGCPHVPLASDLEVPRLRAHPRKNGELLEVRRQRNAPVRDRDEIAMHELRRT